ncbi:MAG: GNAT family N-acetyltransferase [bacterium]|nr:GNAT family N-acetyltransferase [Gammaproteobacteria bacterium]
MNSYRIEVLDELPESMEEKKSQDLAVYESSHGVDVNYNKFSIVLIAKSGESFAALTAYTAYAEVYIDDLWVETSYRGKGHGSKLVQFLEDRFKHKGFNNINLVTSAFQAPGFYIKCGFEAEFTRENRHNPSLSKTFFVKFFDDAVQTQGLKQVT